MLAQEGGQWMEAEEFCRIEAHFRVVDWKDKLGQHYKSHKKRCKYAATGGGISVILETTEEDMEN